MVATNDRENRDYLRDLLGRFGWLHRVRPMPLAELIVRLIAPTDRRRIIDTKMGVRVFADPFSHLGKTLIEQGTYEPETAQLLKQEMPEGGTFLDIGANEGIFSSLVASLVGPKGLVIAVEPQKRLHDIIELNLQINAECPFYIFSNAFGGEENQTASIHLHPSLNTGASSMMQKYRWSKKAEICRFVSLDTILITTGAKQIDLVKIDVEGFEKNVIEHLLPAIREGKIKKVLLDYHTSILKAQGISPESIHQSLTGAGMKTRAGSETLESYVLYARE